MDREQRINSMLKHNTLVLGYVYVHTCSTEGWVYSMEGCIYFNNEAEKQEAVRRAASYK
jgi:hypothetical protein